MQDVGATPFEVDFNGQPNETNKKLYDQSSILDKVTASKKSNLVVMYGNKDTQVPYDQSVYFYTEAIKKGLQNIRLVELSNEKHVIKGLAQANKVCTELKTMTKLTKMQCLINQ
jgi:dipeptidyl aminopeptidase/acylaminoacyl peptidase